MKEHVMDIVLLAVGVIIVCFLVYVVMTLKTSADPAIESGVSRITQITSSMDNDYYSAFDNKNICGNEAINAIRRFAAEDFPVTVKTKKGSETYTEKNSYTAATPKDKGYIEPTGKFEAKLNQDENGSTIGITITQK